MKPLLIAFTFLTVLFSQPSFATEKNVTPTVLKSFEKTFTTAKAVEWVVSQNLYKARFELNGQVVCAYYNNEGALMAVTRNITAHQLPFVLQTNLMKGHENHWITELFELSNEGGTTYYAVLETADSKVMLQSVGKTWSPYQKARKD